MPVGRPPKFASVEDLQAQIDKYFADCDAREKPYTITGLALALDTSRETLCQYSEKCQYVDTIKRAKLRCENYVEERLFTGNNAAGAIFALKNYGWTDKQTVESTGLNGGPLMVSVALTDEQLMIIAHGGMIK